MAKTELAKAYVQIMPSADGIKGKLTEALGGEASNAGKSAGGNFVGKLKGIIAAAGIGTMVKEALSAGANLQQSFGGIDTIYADAADSVKKFASEAAAAGISANDYAEQAVSFGASLKQAFGGDMTKAADAANMAIMDMADNAAKMGTDVESIQNAYQGFAKGNYTMLDNLKLGYGGTKEEMQRLLAKAEELSGVEYNIDNLGDVYKAIHVIQDDLGIMGVAADEAKITFSGSMDAMKAAAENLMANMTLGEDIGPSLQLLGETVFTFLTDNLLPMVVNLLEQLPTLIESVVDMILNYINSNQSNFLEQGGKILVSLATGIIRLIPKIVESGAQTMGSFIQEIIRNLPTILTQGGALLAQLIQGIADAIPGVEQVAKNVIATAKETFENTDWKEIGKNIIDGIVNGLKNATSALWEAVKSIAKDAIGFAKSVLGIASPSKVMRDEVGKWIPEGMAVGIKNHSNAVKDAMNELTDTASGSIQTDLNMRVSANGRAMNGFGGWTQNVNIYSPKALSASEVARQTRNANRQMVLSMKGVG